jgi:7-keto-8-aminopelargonate synthetase-like enzyme
MAQSDSGLPDSLPFSARLQARLESLATRQQLRGRSVLQRTSAVHCHDGRQQLISFATNDYLGLSCEPRVCQAFADTALQQAGSGASPLVAGRSHWQERLETRLAELEGCESVVLFASGYAANLGTLMALAGRMRSFAIAKTMPVWSTAAALRTRVFWCMIGSSPNDCSAVWLVADAISTRCFW